MEYKMFDLYKLCTRRAIVFDDKAPTSSREPITTTSSIDGRGGRRKIRADRRIAISNSFTFD